MRSRSVRLPDTSLTEEEWFLQVRDIEKLLVERKETQQRRCLQKPFERTYQQALQSISLRSGSLEQSGEPERRIGQQLKATVLAAAGLTVPLNLIEWVSAADGVRELA